MAALFSSCFASIESLGSEEWVSRKRFSPEILCSSAPCKGTVLLYRILLDRPFPSSILFMVTISLVPPSSSPSSCTSSHTVLPPPPLEDEEEDGNDKEERFLAILQFC